MEPDLKILEVEYLSNHLMDHTQILNLSLDDQTIFYKSLKWRQPSMEDNLICKDGLKALHVLRGKLEITQSKTQLWLCSAQLIWVIFCKSKKLKLNIKVTNDSFMVSLKLFIVIGIYFLIFL